MTQSEKKAEPVKAEPATPAEQPVCGVVRPISPVEGYADGHWLEVHDLIADAATSAGYKARLVSDDEAIGVIMGTIVSNLHDDPIVVVDVSTLNPNVMFELGMRLTFEKPVVVIKDTATSRVPFDASPIEYLEYPTDLRHAPLMTFQRRLTSAIQQTAEKASKPGYRSFLKHFGSFKPGELGESQSIDTRLILEELANIRAAVRRSEPSTLSEIVSMANAPRHGLFGKVREQPTIRDIVNQRTMHVLTPLRGQAVLDLVSRCKALPGVRYASSAVAHPDGVSVNISYDCTVIEEDELLGFVRAQEAEVLTEH